jgi:hypothetical protein
MGRHLFNSVAYADDVTLMAALPDDLQCLINACTRYADKWRFKYGFKKTVCMTAGRCPLSSPPSWTLKNEPIQTADSLTILGVTYSSCTSSGAVHTENRISAARRSMYGLAHAGALYPGLCTEAKVHIWKTIGLPTLTYGLEAVPLTKASLAAVEKCQATLIKRCLGLNKRSHHSNILHALNIAPVLHSVNAHAANVYTRIFKRNSPALLLNSFLLARFISTNVALEGTLLHRILTMGASPVRTLLRKKPCCSPFYARSDGVIDSLKFLLHHANYVKPWSTEFILTSLMTKCF